MNPKRIFLIVLLTYTVIMPHIDVQSATTRYFNGTILRDHQLKHEDLWVKDGRIIAPQASADKHIDVQGAIIAPGYIDIQINGAFGYDFSSEPHAVDKVARSLPKYGVTSFLPTVISSSAQQYSKVLPLLQPRARRDHSASILGIHLEGPFFATERHGAHDLQILQSLDGINALEAVYGSLDGVKIVTLAPELPGALTAICDLASRGIIVSAGHTDAPYDVMLEGIEHGVRLITHLFNAMVPLHHRQPGIIGAALTHPDILYSIIADNQHIHPAVINLAWRASPANMILVTDAMAALGLPDGTYALGTQEITLFDGKAVVAGTNVLAGSVISMDVAVRNLRSATECTAVEAVEAATLKPAQLLGIANHKGTLDLGADADFLLLDEELNVLQCYLSGELFLPEKE